MIINFNDLAINLYDGDTETESGELHQVERIDINDDTFSLLMSNGNTWDGADLTPYERDLIITEITEQIKSTYNSVSYK